MNKSILPVMLLLAAVAGVSFVSCNKQGYGHEQMLDEEQQQNKIDETGEAFIAELDLDNWKGTVELVLPAVNFLDGCDLDPIEENVDDIESWTESYDAGSKLYSVVTETDFSKLKGHWTIGAITGTAKADKGDFNDFVLSFTAENHKYVANITVINSDTRILVNSYTDPYYWGYSDENGYWVYEPGVAMKREDYLILPKTIIANFTVDGSKTFSVESGISYSGKSGDLLDDLAGGKLNASASLAVKAGDYSMELSQLTYTNNTANEKFTLKHGNKILLSLNSNATGLKFEEAADEPVIYCDNATVALDVLGSVQVKGSVRYNELNKAVQLVYEKAEEDPTAEQVQAQLDLLKPYYDLNVYYDGGSALQAYVSLMAVEMTYDGEKEIETLPVINFQDGTSTAVPEFFDPDRFAKTITACRALQNKIEEYFSELFQIDNEDTALR